MERSFNVILAELRRENGLSQRKLAADLKISQALLSHYENGTREPGLPFICRACDYFGVSADYILGRAEKTAEANAHRPKTAALSLPAGTDRRTGAAAEKYLAAAAKRVTARLGSSDSALCIAELSLEMANAELELLQAIASGKS